VWEGEPSVKGKERHLFLFRDKLLITRKKKSEERGELPIYEFRGMIDVCACFFSFISRFLTANNLVNLYVN